jgi:2-succinyl-6-hydroxy-2,4-cyclohexadiene-1-carboxylate synthase
LPIADCRLPDGLADCRAGSSIAGRARRYDRVVSDGFAGTTHDCGAPPTRVETVVMLHGFAGTSRAFDAVRALLPAQRFESLALDLPGHGSRSRETAPDLKACIQLVLDASPERFVLCGYSQGGRIALHVALAAPARVARLVPVSTSPGIESEQERAARRASDDALASQIERDGLERFAERWRSQPLFADEPANVAELARADHVRNTPAGLAAALRGLGAGTMEPVWERLGELEMPVRLLAGERDEKYVEIARRMAALLPHCELAIVPGGHGLLLESPDAVAAAIVA